MSAAALAKQAIIMTPIYAQQLPDLATSSGAVMQVISIFARPQGSPCVSIGRTARRMVFRPELYAALYRSPNYEGNGLSTAKRTFRAQVQHGSRGWKKLARLFKPLEYDAS